MFNSKCFRFHNIEQFDKVQTNSQFEKSSQISKLQTRILSLQSFTFHLNFKIPFKEIFSAAIYNLDMTQNGKQDSMSLTRQLVLIPLYLMASLALTWCPARNQNLDSCNFIIILIAFSCQKLVVNLWLRTCVVNHGYKDLSLALTSPNRKNVTADKRLKSKINDSLLFLQQRNCGFQVRILSRSAISSSCYMLVFTSK